MKIIRQVRRATERAAAKADRPIIGRRQPVREFRVSGAVARSKYMPHVGQKERGRYA